MEMPVEGMSTKVVELCLFLHESVGRLAAEFKDNLGRHYCTTPMLYLTLVRTFKTLLGAKLSHAMAKIRRYASLHPVFALPAIWISHWFYCAAVNIVLDFICA
jgi:hypothetical protein